jgi:phage-related protein (TIGR01555 family)
MSNRKKRAADGYSNPLAGLGDASALLSGGTYERAAPLTPSLLTALYRESWLAKRIIDMPSEDMTRAWYRLNTALPERETDILRRLEAKHSVKQEITNAIRWGRLYGGALAVMVIKGEEDRLEEPLDPDDLLPGCFQGLLVLDRAQGIMPSLELVSDLDDPDFGYPEYYTVSLEMGDVKSVKIHHSRVLRFIGRELPRAETVRENYWGASELEHIWDELQKRSAASANIAQLIFQANITTLKMSDFGELLGAGTEEQRKSVEYAMGMENRFRTSFGIQLLSRDDSLENHPYSFTGLSEIYEQFMMDMAGAAEIPATKLFGRSPQGMNATGESDLKNYYELIGQMQERHLRPALERLLPVMALSCWGFMPEQAEIRFPSLMTVSPREEADIRARNAETLIRAVQAGLLTSAEGRDRLLELL